MSQPVYRDSVINGKFITGMVILSVMVTTSMMLVAGYGLRMIGVPPSAEEIIRLFIYLVLIIVYGAFWIGVSILFSILFRSLATSVLCSIALWIFFIFGMPVIAQSTNNIIAIILSPNSLFSYASSAILLPSIRTLGTITQAQAAYMIPNPLSLSQSMILAWPYLTGLVCLSVICFAISYVLFMRQEIRAT
jgi:ABC-2 type transport system permease protein